MQRIDLRRMFVLLAVLVLTGSAHADRPTFVTTARSIGLGGTVTSLADDAAATFWNPSGLPTLQRQEVVFSYADRFGLGINTSYTSYVFPLFERHAIGLGWIREQFGDDELNDALNLVNLTYGMQLHRSISVGVGLKSVFQTIELDGVSLRSASGFGIDVGLLFTPKKAPFDRLRFGLALQDIGGTKLRDNTTQFEEEILEQTIRGGVSVRAHEDVKLALDVDSDDLHFGAEYQPLAALLLRGGVNRPISPAADAGQTLAFALGFGLKWNSVQLDYAYEHHPVLPATHHFTLGLSYNASIVNIKDAIVRPAPIFKSLYRTYEESDFVDVVLRNASPDALPVTVTIDVPTLPKTPHEETIVLAPQTTERYGFTLTFPQDLLSTQPSYYDNLVQPTVKITYRQGRASKTATRTLNSVYVLGKGKLSWSNPRRIAAFITPESRTVDAFARGLVGNYADLLREKFGNNNIGKAALIFDAIGAHGLRYQQDQTTPYLEIFQDDSVFDSVKYPYEYLDVKIGDCDDCTALFCSMLENLNIPTAILDVNDPQYGHIYMMFDSGISVQDAGDYFLNEREYVLWDNRIWLPIETTLFGSSFSDAWRNGAEEYYVRKERGFINEILVSEAQQTFRPGVVPDSDIALPSETAIQELFDRDLAFFETRLDQIALASGVSLDSAEGLYDAGATYLRLNQLERAETSLTEAIKMDSGLADAYNALGVVMTKRRRYDEALDLYNRALELNPRDAGFRINLALTYHLQGRGDDAEQVYREAVSINRDFAGVLDFLGGGSGAGRPTSVDPLQRIASEKAYDDGAAYLRLKRYDRATEQFDRALSMNPGNGDALNGQGVIATRQHNYDEAIDAYRKAIATDPNNAGYQANLAITYHLQGKTDEAIAAYKKAVAFDASYEGQLDVITGGKPIAEISVSASAGGSVGPLQRIASDKAYDDGAAFLRLKRYDRAVEAFDRALSLNPGNTDALNGKGVVLTHQRDYSGAAKSYQQAIEGQAQNAGYHLNLAILRHLQGDADAARQAYQKAVELEPSLKGQLEFLE